MSEQTVCKFPGCPRHPQKNGYCVGHGIYAGGSTTESKPAAAVKAIQKPIANKSNKRKEEQKEYIKIVKEFLKIDPNCSVKVFGCEGKATGLHHLAKRSPANFLDRNNLIRACNSCQLWIEIHPLEAIEQGFSVSKFKPKEK